jgi:Right handed beta helix region
MARLDFLCPLVPPMRAFVEGFLRRKLFDALLVIVLLLPLTPARAQTLYVDDDDPASCACGAPAGKDDAACGRSDRPFSCIRDAIAGLPPTGTIIVRDGTYHECVAITRGGTSETERRTLQAENVHGATIACPTNKSTALYLHTSFLTVRGFRITGGGTGIHIDGGKPDESDTGKGIAVEDTEVFGNDTGVLLQRNSAGVRLTRLDIHHNTPHDGLKLDTYYPGRITDTLVEDCHIHHNRNQGIGEGNAEHTIIRNCEIDNNGTDGQTHGFYLKGFEGLIQNNKVHHNSGYGIHLWSAPRGTPAHHYIVERNDVYANGSGGIVLGGTPGEAAPSPHLPPGDGLPHSVEIRYNRIHDNPKTGFVYYGSRCDDSANDNSFHDNLVYDNGALAFLLSTLRDDATNRRLVLKDNVFLGPPYKSAASLALFINTQLDPGALDGNIFYMPGADSTTPGLFRWQCYDCRKPPDAEVRYSFDQFRNAGIEQDNTRRPDLNCGTTTTLKLDEQSRWADPQITGQATSAPPDSSPR